MTAFTGTDVYTTGQVAQITGLSVNTVKRCFHDGMLQGFTIPGSHHRRITRESLERFIAENELPVELEGR